MNAWHEPTEDNVIKSWHERAYAYQQLIKRWPIFTTMVNRLLAYIPNEFNGHALDIAGGSGLLSKYLLKKHPNAHVTLIEPAVAMRDLAFQQLGNKVDIKDVTSDNLDKLNIVADVALCSASFHLMNEETTLPSIASVLKSGSVFAVNCWGHSFSETKNLDKKEDWMHFVDQALNEFNLPPMNRPKRTKRSIKSTDKLQKIGKNCGLHLCDTSIVTTEIKTQFSIEFAAMDPYFLHQVEREIREQVITRAMKLCRSIDTISFADLIFEKV